MNQVFQTFFKRVQSNWTMADPNDPSFILNKPVLDATNLTAGTGISITGIFPDFTISALNTQALWNANALQGISISNTVPTLGQVLSYNGTNWIPTTIGAGTGTVTSVNAAFGNGDAVSFSGGPINTSGVLTATWLGNPAQYTNGEGKLTAFPSIPAQFNPIAGMGINITGSYPNMTFVNTLPDQIVSLIGTGATTISGTYPSFTINSVDTNTTYTAGSGLSLTGTVFANTAPDQIVSITGTGGATVTGTYPNFNINTVTSTVNNGQLTIGTSGIASGSTTFTANQATNSSVTINVPATDLTSNVIGNNVTINSSTGADTTFTIPTTPIPNLQQVTDVGNTTINPIIAYSYDATNGTYSMNINNIGSVDARNRGMYNSYSGQGTFDIVRSSTNNTLPSIVDFSINRIGQVQIPDLAGGGMVVASAGFGVLSVQPIPAGDQIVSLTGVGITTITGTYPNFTITTPGTNIGSSLTGNTLNITSSTGTGTSIALPAQSDDIHNQNINPQSANYYITGIGVAGTHQSGDNAQGKSLLANGGTTNAGYIELYNPNQTVNGYIGSDLNSMRYHGNLGLHHFTGVGMQIDNLSGTGTRMVTASSTGVLSAQAIPSNVNILAGTGITVTGIYPNITITNSLPDQTIILTGSGATSVTGTYPSFNISSTDTNTTYSAGTGLSLVGTTFNNTAPDQVVSITGSGAAVVTGTYPSFNINVPSVTDTNFSNTNLTFTGSRVHNVNGNTLEINNATVITLQADNEVIVNSSLYVDESVTLNDLSGIGTRMVVADSIGVLSTLPVVTDTNFAISNLTLTGNRLHDFAGNVMDFINAGYFAVDASNNINFSVTDTNSYAMSISNANGIHFKGTNIDPMLEMTSIGGTDTLIHRFDTTIINNLPPAPTGSYKILVRDDSTKELRVIDGSGAVGTPTIALTSGWTGGLLTGSNDDFGIIEVTAPTLAGSSSGHICRVTLSVPKTTIMVPVLTLQDSTVSVGTTRSITLGDSTSDKDTFNVYMAKETTAGQVYRIMYQVKGI